MAGEPLVFSHVPADRGALVRRLGALCHYKAHRYYRWQLDVVTSDVGPSMEDLARMGGMTQVTPGRYRATGTFKDYSQDNSVETEDGVPYVRLVVSTSDAADGSTTFQMVTEDVWDADTDTWAPVTTLTLSRFPPNYAVRVVLVRDDNPGYTAGAYADGRGYVARVTASGTYGGAMFGIVFSQITLAHNPDCTHGSA